MDRDAQRQAEWDQATFWQRTVEVSTLEPAPGGQVQVQVPTDPAHTRPIQVKPAQPGPAPKTGTSVRAKVTVAAIVALIVAAAVVGSVVLGAPRPQSRQPPLAALHATFSLAPEVALPRSYPTGIPTSPAVDAPSNSPSPLQSPTAKTAPLAPTTTRVPAPPADLAAGRPMTSSGFTDVYPGKNANDGDPDTYWESTNNAFPQWLQVDLGRANQVSRFLLQVPPQPLWLQRTQTIQITGSMDGSNYFVILGPAGYSFDPANANAVQVRFTRPPRGTCD